MDLEIAGDNLYLDGFDFDACRSNWILNKKLQASCLEFFDGSDYYFLSGLPSVRVKLNSMSGFTSRNACTKSLFHVGFVVTTKNSSPI